MLKKITEGKAIIYHHPGETSKKAKVFFNPLMKLNRDISVLALKVFQNEIKRTLVVADVLAGTGIRGIRYSLEVSGIDKVFINDLNPNAIKLIEKNIKLNRVKNAEISRKDANVLLSENKYLIDFVDIDPFGSPVQHLDSAARAVSNKGFLGVTATDTGPLCGTYPRACRRRYNAVPLREDIMHEVGIRILIANIARDCSRYDKGFIPVLSFSKIHYFRIFGRIKKSKSAAEKNIENIGYAVYCRNCGFRKFSREKESKCESCKKEVSNAGPLWTGDIFEKSFIGKMLKDSDDNEAVKLLEIIKEEAGINHPFYDLHKIAGMLKAETPKIDVLTGKLEKKGFMASRTHFLGSGVRTDADIKTIKKLFTF